MRLLVLGATGLLGHELCQQIKRSDFDLVTGARSGADLNFDITDPVTLRDSLNTVSADLVINAAANVNLADCQENPMAAFAINAAPVQVISKWCAEQNKKLVQISTDHFFDGDGRKSHDELADITIVNQYARTKFAAEEFANTCPDALIIRTSIAGIHPDGRGLANWAFNQISTRKPMKLFNDSYGSIIDTVSFSNALLDLIASKASGVINLASSQISSKQEFIIGLAKVIEVDLDWGVSCSIADLQPQRAKATGLNVQKAEAILGYKLPGMMTVSGELAEQWKRQSG
ncbi:MAG: SDR family oxidoreductase [Robiginitomaculum sp.]|nr:SDR family oxidoreductase [Robiginitomaculum sp.]